ncbi:ImmA/IrrE family metallo-endopeptidase [Modestobacter sp. Leaf380]|uniref:ImmA/IrrE family metallo-endopeptidase n=1 Tax=Modestobacter sp. Leaf380 TaxID=1736356 RepID=UPI00350F2D13
MYGLRGERPRPLLALNIRPAEVRTRFTLGHEFGHLMLAWHAGTISCHPAELGDPEREADAGTQALEREADAFSARVLVPLRFLKSLAGLPVPEMLEQLELAEVSRDAGVRSLAAMLPPGHIFALLDRAGTRVASTYRSPETRHAGFSRGDELDTRRLERVFDLSGLAHHHGRTVWWGQASDSFDAVAETADWRTELLGILADIAPGELPSGKLYGRVSAIAASAHSQARGLSAEVLAARMRHAYRLKDDLAEFVAHPRFDSFVLSRTRSFRPGQDL